MRTTKKIAVILAGFLIAANALSCGITQGNEDVTTKALETTKAQVDAKVSETTITLESTDTGIIGNSEESPADLCFGEWYHCFIDDNGDYGFYSLYFKPESSEMEFNYGYYESEYVNRYKGTYTVSENGVYSAALHDDNETHSNPDIALTFTLTANAGAYGSGISFVMLSCDVESYKPLIGKRLDFSREMASYVELSAVDDGDFRIYTIPADGGNLTIRIPCEWHWNNGDFTEDTERIGQNKTQKRTAFHFTRETLKDFEDQLKESESRQYNLDAPITGQTDSGLSYIGYYGDEEMPKGEMSRRYLFYISVDDGAYIVEIWQRLDFDKDEFFDETVIPIIRSIDIK